MSKYDEKLTLLEDLRARVIYYSCIAEPKNIVEISELWDYKTSTYFYQTKSKEVTQEMVSKKLVSMLKGGRFQSNYNLLLEKKEATEFFERTNNRISNEIIIEKYDWEVTEGQLEDPLFKEFCIEKKPELKKILDETKIVGKEIEKFLSLWKASLFKKIFLSADCIKKLVGDRRQLPENPRDLLFDITVDTCESIYYYKEEGRTFFADPFLSLGLETNEVYPLILAKLKSAMYARGQFLILSKRLKEVYEVMKNKIATYQGRSEVGSYHIAKIVEMMGL